MNPKRTILIAVLSAAITTGLILAVVLPLAGRAMAQPQAGAPTVINYQGYLTDDAGTPIDGSADLRFRIYASESSNNVEWEEEHIGVLVTMGYFSVELGSSTALSADVFSDTERWLQVEVKDDGIYTSLGRERVTSVPYALQSQQAQTASSAPWSGLTNVPAGFADDLDGVEYDNVVVVAKSGGDFNTIQAAIDSISDASDTNRYLIWVAPGIYEEQVIMKPYVDIKGSGMNTTKITYGGSSTLSTGTIVAASDARLSFLAVENVGDGVDAYAVGIYNSGTERFALMYVKVNASEATHNYAMYNTNSSWTSISRGSVVATGGSNAYVMYNHSSIVTISYAYLAAREGGNNYGVESAGTSNVKVLYSRIHAQTNTIVNGTSSITQIALSQLEYGAIGGATGTTCAGTYDENYVFYNGCP